MHPSACLGGTMLSRSAAWPTSPAPLPTRQLPWEHRGGRLGAPGLGAVTHRMRMWGGWGTEPCPTLGATALAEPGASAGAEISAQSFVGGDQTPAARGSLRGLGTFSQNYRDRVKM